VGEFGKTSDQEMTGFGRLVTVELVHSMEASEKARLIAGIGKTNPSPRFVVRAKRSGWRRER